MEELFILLDEREIDFRIESNFCCGYLFYFLNGSIYPRRYTDMFLDRQIKILTESTEAMIKRVEPKSLEKDWYFMFEGATLKEVLSVALDIVKDPEKMDKIYKGLNPIKDDD